MKRAVTAVVLAALVVLAGCSASLDGTPLDGTDAGPTTQADQGSINFYVSDERNAINDFQSLNVTITAVGFKKANTSESNETPTPNNTTATESPTVTVTEGDSGEIADKQASGDWVVKQVDNRTVDLTELQGANASKLGTFGVEPGTYTKVFVYISDVDATLKNGEKVNVKLPSEKLHLNKRFTVGQNQSVDFVFDITVFKAGQSGKYILKPVVSQSGTDVAIEDVDEERGEDADELTASFTTDVVAGENATVEVLRNGTPVENASVSVNGESVGTTDANGTLTFAVPTDAEELEVEIRGPEGGEAELERRLAGAEGQGADDEGAGDDAGDDVAALNLTVLTENVTAGEEATIEVTKAGEPVAGAEVKVNGETVGRTADDGTFTFTVPEGAAEVEIEVKKAGQDASTTLVLSS